jgi:hypothetical protein
VVNQQLRRANRFFLQNYKEIETLDTMVHQPMKPGDSGYASKHAVYIGYRFKQSTISYARILKNNAKEAGIEPMRE